MSFNITFAKCPWQLSNLTFIHKACRFLYICCLSKGCCPKSKRTVSTQSRPVIVRGMSSSASGRTQGVSPNEAEDAVESRGMFRLAQHPTDTFSPLADLLAQDVRVATTFLRSPLPSHEDLRSVSCLRVGICTLSATARVCIRTSPLREEPFVPFSAQRNGRSPVPLALQALHLICSVLLIDWLERAPFVTLVGRTGLLRVSEGSHVLRSNHRKRVRRKVRWCFQGQQQQPHWEPSLTAFGLTRESLVASSF